MESRFFFNGIYAGTLSEAEQSRLMGYAQEIMLRNYFVPRLKACAMSCAFAVITSIVVFVMTGNLPLSDSNFSLSDHIPASNPQFPEI